MSAGNWFGEYLGEWTGASDGAGVSHTDAGLVVSGLGSSVLAATKYVSAELSVSGSGTAALAARVETVSASDTRLDQILAILTGRKVFDEVTKTWHVYDSLGNELVDSTGILLQGLHGWLLRGANEVEELIQGGGIAKPKKQKRPAWVIPAKFIKLPPRPLVEEEEALMLCGAL